METRKLAHFLDAQRAVVRRMDQAAVDLLGFYVAEDVPDLLSPIVAQVRTLQERDDELSLPRGRGKLVAKQISPPLTELETSHPTFANPPLR